jgi:phage tail sheath protein FI
MPEYLAPGVYIEELNTGPVPIEGVSTSTAGFVGQTERGPVQPTLVTSFGEYQRWFGGFLPDPSNSAISFLPFAAKGFFDNGGQRLFIARAHATGIASGSQKAEPATLSLAGTALSSPPNEDLTLKAIGPGQWGQRIFARVQDSTLRGPVPPSSLPGTQGPPIGFRLTLLYYQTMPPSSPFVDPTNQQNRADPNVSENVREPSVVEDYDNLRIDPNSQDYALKVINAASQLVHIPDPQPRSAYVRPPNTTVTAPDGGFIPFATNTGIDGTTPLTADDYIGDHNDGIPANDRVGLVGLETISDISLVCVPDEVNLPDITDEIVNQCHRSRYRFAILQVPGGQGNVNNLPARRDTSYAAIYYPWVRVLNPATLDYPKIPPGGHVAGIYAATDINRGVHKAPANVEVAGIVTRDIDSQRKPLEFLLTKGQQDILNPRGVNVIRDFRSDGRGIRVWGARTTSTDTQWKYINVRRLFIFVEASIDRGTQWVVFEPNDEPTWARVRRSITNFLGTVWRNGALMGATQEEAFFVKCDRTTMTQDDIDNGRLICYIGIAPVKPAEFVIFRISQKTIEAAQ